MNNLIIRNNPFRNLFKRLDNEFINDFKLINGKHIPSTDIYEKDDKVFIEAEMPGLKKEDIEIKLDNGMITFSGQRKDEKEIKEKDYYYCERSFGNFSRAFNVSKDLKPEDISAEYQDGILKINFPKKKEGNDNLNIKKIEIK